MRDTFKNKFAYKAVFEFLLVSAIIAVCLSNMVSFMVPGIKGIPEALDHWHICATLEYQTTRILGMDSWIGLWDGGTFYPYHEASLLFDEPRWGIALMIAPIWLLTKNIFPIFFLGGIPALFLSWICTYYFMKALGVGRIWAFLAGAAFVLSGVSLILTSLQTCFWPFFIVPLLGSVTVKLFSTKKWFWAGLWGLLYGYLAWSSLHIFVMASAFLFLFIAWKLAFEDRSRKTVMLLLAAFLIGSILAGGVLISIYTAHERFGFYRNQFLQYEFATNWANLIFRHWPLPSYNPITKTPLWEQIGAHAKGETNIGLSLFVLLGALGLCIARLRRAVPVRESRRRSVVTFSLLVGFVTGLAWLNMHCIRLVDERHAAGLPSMAVGLTYFYYFIAGAGVYVLRHRIWASLRHLDFMFFLAALLFGFLAFGPYYMISDGKAVASPVAFLIYNVAGFSGIGATARWGLILSFTLAIAVAVFFSGEDTRWKGKIAGLLFVVLCLVELSPGINLSKMEKVTPYQWKPKQVDIFLKDLPDGAVLEMSDYPLKTLHGCLTEDCHGARLYARTFHKKLLVNGYAHFGPRFQDQYLYLPESTEITSDSIKGMRKLGPRYWVVHMKGWPEEKVHSFKSSVGNLRLIATFNEGNTLVYEDPDPRISVPTTEEVLRSAGKKG